MLIPYASKYFPTHNKQSWKSFCHWIYFISMSETTLDDTSSENSSDNKLYHCAMFLFKLYCYSYLPPTPPFLPPPKTTVTLCYGKRLRKCTAVSEWPLRVGLGSHWCVSEAVLKLPPRWLWPLTAILMAWSCSSWWALTASLINTGFHPQSERDTQKPITGPEHEPRTPEVNH